MKCDPKYFKTALSSHRVGKGYTQADLAAKCGLQPTAISHFETGQRTPSLKNLCAICNALQVPPEMLLVKL